MQAMRYVTYTDMLVTTARTQFNSGSSMVSMYSVPSE